MGVPRVWRNSNQRYQFKGYVCPQCGNVSLMARAVCPYCHEPDALETLPLVWKLPLMESVPIDRRE